MDIKFEYYNLALTASLLFMAFSLILSAIYLFNNKIIYGKFTAYVLRAATVFLLLISLANPYLEDKSISSARAYALIDISESNDEAVMQQMLDRLMLYQEAGIDLNLIPFAGSSEGIAFSRVSSNYRSMKLALSRLDIGKTNIENALKYIENKEPGSVLLLSDGYQTEGDAFSVVTNLKESGFRIYPLVPATDYQASDKLVVSNLHAPLIARQGKSVSIRTSIKNATSSAQSGKLEVKHGEKTVYSRTISVPQGREELFLTDSSIAEEGIKEITAVFQPDNKNFPVSSRTIFLSSEKGEKVLLLNGSTEDQNILQQVFKNQSYQLKSLLPNEIKNLNQDFSEFSTVIFNNISLDQLPRGTASNIEAYVQAGGSFIMIGGNRSFGLGGYINSAIEDVLPVEMLPPQKEEKRLNVAVQLLIDKSGSMSTGRRMDFAKEAAIGVVDNLKDDDFVGVMGFDVNPFVVIRLARVRDIRAEAERRIGLLFPSKGTSVIAALDEARRDLVRASAGRKHMVLLTDGEITDAPKHYYLELIKQIRLLGITVSTVLVGSEGGQAMLKEMSDVGGGAFYHTRDARALPNIFIEDLKVASGERTLKEQSDYLVREGPSGLLSTRVRNYPKLMGYVQTKSKARASLELVAMADNKAEPVLASWKYGKGKSAAYTSDANGRWSRDWVTWAGFQNFWTDILDSLRKESVSAEDMVRFDLKTYYENAKLYLDLSVFSEAERSSLEAEVIFPDASKHQISLRAVAPGRYMSSIDSPQAGKYEFYGKFAAKDMTPVAFYLSGELLGEVKGKGFNLPFLRSIADSSGGKFNPESSELKTQEYTYVSTRSLYYYVLLSALCFFLLEILLREGVIRIQRPFRASL